MGDFSRSFHRPDAGINTVEGNVSGARAMQLEKQRQEQQELFEEKRRQQQQNSSNSALGIHNKFQAARIGSQQEQDFRAKTVGLVSARDFLTATKDLESNNDTESKVLEKKRQVAEQARIAQKKEKKKKKKHKRKIKSLLSFADDDADWSDDEKARKVVKKDPTIDTSFLPDKQRENEEVEQKKTLEKQWSVMQEEIRKQQLEVVYSFWDGSGHRRTINILKGSSVGDFLEAVRRSLCSEFKELGNVSSDALMFVKEDLVSIELIARFLVLQIADHILAHTSQILPHDITFYDLISTKARGKSGPLFQFDVHDDIRLGPIDSRIEKDGELKSDILARRLAPSLTLPICPRQNRTLERLSKDVGTNAINIFSRHQGGSFMTQRKNTASTLFGAANRQNVEDCGNQQKPVRLYVTMSQQKLHYW